MEFSEPIALTSTAFYFAACSSDINIKFSYTPDELFAFDGTFSTFNNGRCTPANFKILGNYVFTTQNSA